MHRANRRALNHHMPAANGLGAEQDLALCESLLGRIGDDRCMLLDRPLAIESLQAARSASEVEIELVLILALSPQPALAATSAASPPDSFARMYAGGEVGDRGGDGRGARALQALTGAFTPWATTRHARSSTSSPSTKASMTTRPRKMRAESVVSLPAAAREIPSSS